MTYVEAATAPLRKTGQIKLHGPDGFAGMRKAGQLVAEILDLLTPEVRPGVTTDELDRMVRELSAVEDITETEAAKLVEAQLMKAPTRNKAKTEGEGSDVEAAA